MKPLGRKNYGSIGHLPCSRMGPADHSVHEGQARICTIKARDKHDVIIVTEKLDGSNVGITRIGSQIIALGRAGYPAQSSKYEQHQLFAAWVRKNELLWLDALGDGERLIGEWVAQAHGTKYDLRHRDPIAFFDLMVGDKRLPFEALQTVCEAYALQMPKILSIGGPMSVESAMKLHGFGCLDCDEPEGIVYRVERDGEFDFMAKWVRPDKIDGKYLPEVTGSISSVPVWNWRPSSDERTLPGNTQVKA